MDEGDKCKSVDLPMLLLLFSSGRFVFVIRLLTTLPVIVFYKSVLLHGDCTVALPTREVVGKLTLEGPVVDRNFAIK